MNDILEDYDEDTEFFATLKSRFEKALAQQKQHTTVLAQRLRIAEEGKQRHAQAQCFANSVITQATASLTSAEPLSNLFDHWFNPVRGTLTAQRLGPPWRLGANK